MTNQPLRITPERPFFDEREHEAARKAIESGVVGGGGPWLEDVEARLRERLGCRHALAVTSCTHALEMALWIHEIGAGDEVIVPSFTFPSTATCVIREGAKVVFADVRESDLCIDPEDVRRKLTPQTKAIIAVHYAGMACDMRALSEIAEQQNLILIEDAAHALDARYHGQACGTIGDVGCLSFQSAKSLTCGEGGAFLTDDDRAAERLGLFREMGTDRSSFRRRQVARYTWREQGSSFIPSEILMAVLSVQLEKADLILERRRAIVQRFTTALASMQADGRLALPRPIADSEPNAHIYFVLLTDSDARAQCEQGLSELGIPAHRHYDALDATPMGLQLLPPGDPGCPTARSAAQRLLRLPLHPRMTDADVDNVIDGLGKVLSP